MNRVPIAEHTSPLDARQAEQLNQLIDTLSPTQVTWISGYLSGINAALSEGQVAAPAVTAPAALNEARLTILFGSQTGNAEGIAEQLRDQATARGFSASVVDMDDYKPKDLKKESNVVVIVSTHGEGDPPDNAEALHEFIYGKKAPSLEGVNFAVLALGDSSYEHFCKTGQDFDEQLEKLGAYRVTPRVDCDVDYDDDAEAFIATTLDKLDAERQDDAHPNVAHMPAAATPASAASEAWSRKRPFQAELLTNTVLNGRGSAKEVHHIELATEDSGLVWEPGDSIGVVASNAPAVVDELMGALGLDGDEVVTGVDGEIALRDALTRQYEITTLTRPFVEKYAQLAESEELDALLAEDNREAFAQFIDGRHIVDLVERFPATGLNGSDLVRILRKLPPRLYSIASSHSADPDEVHLTVAAVRYDSHGRHREGVASIHLADRVGDEGEVSIYVDRNKNFRLPEDNDRPIIMIGPGTGVAPFRAFMQEREEREAAGRNWLFFGAQHFLSDFYYQTDWLRWRDSGLLSRIDVAFSRDQAEKIYVQQRLREQGRELWAWLQDGANIYVCGDADAMAHDVHEALIDIISEHGGLDAAAAADHLKQLQKDKRYQRDVY